MLKILVEKIELYDGVTQSFIEYPERTLTLTHTLVSVSRWESKWKRPFLDKGPKENDEIIDYIRCMIIDENVDDIYLYSISDANLNKIVDYIDDSMTATTIKNNNKTVSREVVTSELIYYWMISYNIPFECQHWHFNRLMTLIGVCNVKNAPEKKMSKKELMSRNTDLNRARRKAQNTSG